MHMLCFLSYLKRIMFLFGAGLYSGLIFDPGINTIAKSNLKEERALFQPTFPSSSPRLREVSWSGSRNHARTLAYSLASSQA